VEALKQTVEMLFGQPKDVSTCEVGAVASRKWTEIPPAKNIAKFQPSTGGSVDILSFHYQGCCWNIHEALMSNLFNKNFISVQH